MANEYVLIQPEAIGMGKIAVANGVVDHIATITLGDNKDVFLDDRRALSVSSSEDNLSLDLKVKVRYGKDVNQTCRKLQQDLQMNIELMLDYKDANVNIQVVGFKFN